MRNRNHRVVFYLSDEEYDRLTEQVKECNIPRESFLRQMLKGAKIRGTPTIDVAAMIRELRRIGYNIDQALRDGVKDPEDREMLRQTFEEVRQTLRQIFVAYTGQEPSEG